MELKLNIDSLAKWCACMQIKDVAVAVAVVIVNIN